MESQCSNPNCDAKLTIKMFYPESQTPTLVKIVCKKCFTINFLDTSKSDRELRKG